MKSLPFYIVLLHSLFLGIEPSLAQGVVKDTNIEQRRQETEGRRQEAMGRGFKPRPIEDNRTGGEMEESDPCSLPIAIRPTQNSWRGTLLSPVFCLLSHGLALSASSYLLPPGKCPVNLSFRFPAAGDSSSVRERW